MREVPLFSDPHIGPDNPVCATCRHGARATRRGCYLVGKATTAQALPWEAWVTDFEHHDPRCLCLDPLETPQLGLFAEAGV